MTIPRYTPKELVQGYARWVEERVELGFRPNMLTFMFNPIPGSPMAVQREMHNAVERTYRKVLTRTVRRPRTASWEHLPLWIGCIDWPIYKLFKQHFRDIAPNDGAHMHMVALDPPNSRLARQGKSYEDHIFFDHQKLYFDSEPQLHRIQCQEVMHDAGNVADYVLKALKTRRTSMDSILVLPRARSELE